MPNAPLTPDSLTRQTQLDRLAERDPLDIAVVGGGATGVGVAVDAASRGYKVALLERHDFGHGTSSRSTKLVHGGVRYLEQGNVSLVREALHERGLLLQNAPHVVHPLPTLVPLYQWWEGPYYAAGMKAYDLLAGRQNIERSRWIGRGAALQRVPTLNPDGLRGGVCYYDGQFDDTRLLTNLVQTAIAHGAACLNYAPVRELTRHAGKVNGLVAHDLETGAALHLRARVVVNCGGPFSDGVRRLDEPSTTSWIAASQGAHVVLPKAFLPEESAVIVPRTPDGRVVFAIPWRGRALVGTTDVPLDRTPDEPTATAEEVDYLLETIAPYLRPAPTRADILSTFAGVRPLVQADPDAKTSKLSRDHQLRVSDSGLLSVLGGKWTTYRRMAQDAVDSAAQLGGLNVRPCKTAHLAIPDYAANEAHPVVAPLHPRLPATESHVRRAIRWELARTVEDVLSRRTRCLLLDAHAAIEAAPRVAELLAEALGRDPAWQTGQVTAFTTLARQHTVRP